MLDLAFGLTETQVPCLDVDFDLSSILSGVSSEKHSSAGRVWAAK